MADQVRAGSGSTAVNIFGRTYHLRGDGRDDHLGDLASIVDHKMKEVARATGTADTLKVAILAALNIADDSLRARSGDLHREHAEVENRLDRMIRTLDEVPSD